MTPTVSVVIATYNRSQVLRHAIQSVRDSSLTDWELIVVGDACTDDTAECVASFGDRRIRFVNMPHRRGDQSGPNNHGVTLARGRYIAFLNHDDLYLPDHLATCVAELDRSRADFVWTPCAIARHKPDPLPGERLCSFTLAGVPPATGYSPLWFCSASSWMFRRDLTERVEPWPSGDQTYVLPSQVWLFRVWRSGATLRFVPAVGVIVLPAGTLPGSYTRRESPEHEWLVRWFKDEPRYRELILEEAAISGVMQSITDDYRAPFQALKQQLLRPIQRLLTAAGVHPRVLRMAVIGRPGAIIRNHQRITGAR